MASCVVRSEGILPVVGIEGLQNARAGASLAVSRVCSLPRLPGESFSAGNSALQGGQLGRATPDVVQFLQIAGRAGDDVRAIARRVAISKSLRSDDACFERSPRTPAVFARRRPWISDARSPHTLALGR